MGILDQHLSADTEDTMPRAPAISFALAYAAMVPTVAGTAWSLLARRRRDLPVRLTVGWSGAVLCFLSGVRRGLSFRQKGGATVAQLGTMSWLFGLGAASLLSPWPLVSVLLQAAGFGTMAVADPQAARRHEAPVYFQRLRPVQMLVPVASLGVLALGLLARRRQD